jgi:hypothetical protein
MSKLTNLSYKFLSPSSSILDWTTLPLDSTIYLLGTAYQHRSHSDFLQHHRSLLYLSYKQGFKPLVLEKRLLNDRPISNLSSDIGWGCTIRCSQMLIANALLRATFDSCSCNRLSILKLFDDNARGIPASAFSI